jgi:hypothetical protein
MSCLNFWAQPQGCAEGLGGSDGTLVLSGAELPFVVLADAELTIQPGEEESSSRRRRLLLT